MSDDAGHRRRVATALAVTAVIYAVLVWPALLSGRGGTSEAGDQNAYHVPIIRTMAAQWPHVDLVGYRSATAPGYHLALAWVSRTVGDDLLLLRLVNSLVGLALALVVVARTARAAPPAAALLLALPLLCSSYVLSGAIWLTTDNAALLWVTLAWGGAALVTATPGRLLRWGAYDAVAVLVRQIHVWPAGVITAAGIMASPMGARLGRWIGAGDAGASRAANAWAGAAAFTLPALVLAWLAWRWGGLTPPAYRDLHAAGANPVTLGVALALLGGFGAFFAAAVRPAFVAALRTAGPIRIVGAAALAVAATVIWPTSYDMDAGRWGGPIWNAVRVLPTVGQRSLLLPPLAALGAVLVIGLAGAARARGHGRGAALLLLGILGLVVAQSLNSQCWQRYLEPVLLLGLGWLAALGGAGRSGASPRRWWIGPVLLAAGQLALSGIALYAKMLAAGAAGAGP